MKRLSVVMVVVFVLSALLTACGGGAASASDPVGVVKAALDAEVNKQYDKIIDLACTTKKYEIASQMDFTVKLANAGYANDTIKQVVDSINFSLTSPEFTKVSESNGEAQVRVQGKVVMTFDREKLKAVIATLNKAEGFDFNDDMLNLYLDQYVSQGEQGNYIDWMFDLVKENSKWFICQVDFN